MRWLFKTEPSQYSFADLQQDRITVWEGVSNPAALINLRKCLPGEDVFIYHTGSERRIVGLARITAGPRPDPKLNDARRVVVDVKAADSLLRPVTLQEMKASRALADFDLLRLGRLSIVPVHDKHWREIIRLAGT